MSYKTVLVHVDHFDQTHGRLSAAIELARRHDASIVGLGIRVPRPLPAYAGPAVAPVFIPMMEEESEGELAQAKAFFDEAIKQAGLQSRSEWRNAGGDPAHLLDLHGRYADVVVIGQTDRDTTPDALWDLPDNLVLESTRPVVVVPYIGPRETLGKTVVIAWDGGRPAARAVQVALPILKTAEQVQILSVRPNDSRQRWPGMDLASYLARHGANVVTSRYDGADMNIDDVLLNEVSDIGADLVVMGAYGHSRFRETLLGGTTRSMLRHATVPLLMAH